ncbi:MAG: LysR family transcriptional regulator [Pseudomonadota bacterium]
MASNVRLNLDWNLVRTFVAVAESGSLAAASRELGLAHPTVARHVQQLEGQLGLLLFDRTSQGVVLNDAGRRLATQAQAMRREARAFEQLTDAVRHQPLPRIRITMAELLIDLVPQLLADSLDTLRADATQFELKVANEQVNLLERGADIAFRHVRPTQQELIAKRIGSLRITGYATRAYLEHYGPVTEENVASHRFIDDATDGQFIQGAASVGFHIPESAVVVRTDSLLSQRAAMAAGIGIAALPEPMARAMTGVVPVFDGPENAVVLDVWLAARPDMRDNDQVRTTFELLADRFMPYLMDQLERVDGTSALSPPSAFGAIA